jgi:hypothetical protein
LISKLPNLCASVTNIHLRIQEHKIGCNSLPIHTSQCIHQISGATVHRRVTPAIQPPRPRTQPLTKPPGNQHSAKVTDATRRKHLRHSTSLSTDAAASGRRGLDASSVVAIEGCADTCHLCLVAMKQESNREGRFLCVEE